MNDIAEPYVKLVLALGQHDRDYVDAYYGPPEWKQQADTAKASLDELAGRARTLLEAVGKVPVPPLHRNRCVITTSNGSWARSTRASGCSRERMTFDEESKALYDAVAPTLPESHFQESSTSSKRPSRHRSAGVALRRVPQTVRDPA